MKTTAIARCRILGLLVGSLLVSACSSGPSDSVVTETIREMATRELETLKEGGLVGDLAKLGGYQGADIREVEKVGCQPASENIYDCTVIVESVIKCDPKSFVGLTTQCNTPTRTTSTYRFLKTSKGWEVLSQH